MDIALIGFGNVGRGLVEILAEKQLGFDLRIVAVATSKHGLYRPDGLEPHLLLQGGVANYPDQHGLSREWDAARIAREVAADALVEASPTNLQTAQPALDLCRAALESGKHLVLANKGPAALAYDELSELAKQHNRILHMEATVMAGTPALRTALQALRGCSIQRVRGILNGTTNYILTEMEAGKTYDDALAQAQALGYAETDPSGDVDGWDAAGKVLILAAALFGQKLRLDDLDVTGISDLTADDISAAADDGERWRLIAEVGPSGGRVQPMRLPQADPLANVRGATNAITYSTDLLADVTLIGPGAGRKETGFALLADLIDIHQNAEV